GVEHAAQVKQVGMRTRIDKPTARRIACYLEAVRSIAEQATALPASQEIAGKAPGQSRFADTARPGQQPGVMQTAGTLGGQHRLFSEFMPDQPVVAPGWRPGMRPFEL